MNARIFLLLATSWLAQITAAAEEMALGRLFYTPAWRNELERQKRLLGQSQTQPFAGETMRIDGVVVRASGRNTVWINGAPQPEGVATSDLGIRTLRTDPARVRLAPSGEAPLEAKVGARIERSSRRIEDLPEGGEIRIQRPSR